MKAKPSNRNSRFAIVLAGVALMIVAFLRGNYLLGFEIGIIYLCTVAALVWLIVNSFSLKRKVSLLRKICVSGFAVSVGLALAFPGVINTDVQHMVDDQATMRNARFELDRVYKSDPAFADLTISTTRGKIAFVNITGGLANWDDFHQLKKRITHECPAVEHCALGWKVRIRDTNDVIDGYDHSLFPPSEDAE